MTSCFECGDPILDEQGLGCCSPCHFKIQAAEPSQELKDMRAVYGGAIAKTPGQRVLGDLLSKNPHQFLTRLEKAEAEWRDRVITRPSPVEKETEGSVEDARSEELEDVIRRLLAE